MLGQTRKPALRANCLLTFSRQILENATHFLGRVAHQMHITTDKQASLLSVFMYT